jgi:hypothetical protein
MPRFKVPGVRRQVAASSGGTVTYDTSIGLGVDSTGYADLTRRSGAKRFFVKNGGNDSNNGDDPSFPRSSVSDTISNKIVNFENDGTHILLAEGSTFAETIPFLTAKSGFSAQYPTVIQSYDPTDPLNEAKYGRAYVRNAASQYRDPGTRL